MASDTSQPNTNAAPLRTPRFEGSTIMNAVSGSGSSVTARPIRIRSRITAVPPVSPGRDPVYTGRSPGSGHMPSDRLKLASPADRLATVGNRELAEDAPDVGLDGVD